MASQTVMKILIAVFSLGEYPGEILTGHEPQLMYAYFEIFLQQRGIKRTCSSIYHPQCNGQIERFNRESKVFVQLAVLEQRPLETVVMDYPAVYCSTLHALTGVLLAVLLNDRSPWTMPDIVGLA